MSGAEIPANLFDVVIIGGGPAGLTAGIYAARADLKTLCIEGGSTASQISVTDLVENYPGIEAIGGFELADRMRNQAGHFGVQFASGDVVTIEKARIGDVDGWHVKTTGDGFTALAVIIATGANWRKLGVTGEEAFIGKGVSFCATCDGPFYRDREVVVVGGGDTAVQEALYLTRFAKKVTLVHRRDRLRAAGILRDRAMTNEKIQFAWNAVVSEILGDQSVKGVRLRNVRDPGDVREISADGIFIFIGLIPNTKFLEGIVDLDPQGYVVADSHMQTSAKGIFACGDCIRKLLRQVVTACGDGATAAVAAQHYVEDLKGIAYK
ncbi:MAG: thioredoxin-disulfide reductase [Deltaproteobacteria bacterium]|nr:thioredoxin-disulfide reductase [Deltaproteobacteria bacterium]